MKRSPRPRWRWLLGAALAVLVGFLGALTWVFEAEHWEQTRLVASQREALEQYAMTTLGRYLRDAWLDGASRLEGALINPLEDGGRGFWRDERGQLLFPRAANGGPGRAAALVASLTTAAPDSPGDAPVDERRRLVLAVLRAIAANDAKAIEASTRASFAHRHQYVLHPTDDFSFTLAVLRALAAHGASPKLFQLALHDGLSSAPGDEGLQRQVLRRWNLLGDADARYFCDEVSALSRQVGVEVAPFEERCREATAVVPSLSTLPPLGEGLWLACEGAACWALRDDARGRRGVPVDVRLAQAELEDDMRRRGLLDARDRLTLPRPATPVAAEAVRAVLVMPRLDEAAATSHRALELKLALLAVTLLLALGLVAFAALEQRRRERFVQLKSDFVSTMSHELRTPLTGLRVMAETLEKRLHGVEGARDYPARMVRQLEGLSFLLENVLSFNRLERGRWAAKKQPWQPASMLERLRDEARSVGKPFELDAKGFDGVSVDADAELMLLLFSNLVRNAVTYCERSPARLELSATRSERHLELRVRDNGIGLEPGEHDAVFEAFTRGQRSAGRRGSGLGLALCQRIAELHDATLRVEASSDEGTTFVLVLPAGPVG